jgi:hypothetical protein
MFSKLLTRSSKMHSYRSLIRSVITYGCETWVLKEVCEQQLRGFERKVTRKVHGSIKKIKIGVGE